MSVEWAKLVYGDRPTMVYAPSKLEIKGKDGKDARVYQGSTAPSDTSQLWYNTNDNEVYVYYNGSWRNINSTIKTKLNTVSDTVDSHKRTIAEYETKFTNMGRDIRTNLTKITTVEQSLEGFKTTVKNQNYLSIINQQAGKQVFQVSNGRTTGKLMITPETVYINDATIKSSHISSLSASKLTAGTIDAKKIDVININASNITTGKISGYLGYWDLNNGEFYNGYSYSNIRLSNGVAKFADTKGSGIVIESGVLTLSTNITASSSYTKVGELSSRSIWEGSDDVKTVGLSHYDGTTMGIAYYNNSDGYYHPYIVFDKYRKYYYDVEKDRIDGPAPILVTEPTMFKMDAIFGTNSCIKFSYAGLSVARCEVYTDKSRILHGVFIGAGTAGLYVIENTVCSMDTNSKYTIISGEHINIDSVRVYNG